MIDPSKILARDVMSRDLVTLHEGARVPEAISTLEDYHLSGAPVVNDLGECVGVFSTSDLLKQCLETEEGETPLAGSYFSSDPLTDESEGFGREDYDPAVLGADTVGEWMTPLIRSVSPACTIEEVCRHMMRDGIHRVLVMEKKKLVGIITTTDIVRLLAEASPLPAASR